jgi:hypothetical protein
MLHVFEQVRFKDMRLLTKWAVFAALCPLVTLLHPYTYQPFMISLEMARGNEAAQFIGEWQPFNAKDSAILEAGLLAALMALLMLRLRLTWSKAAFAIFALHMFLVHARFGYVFFLLVPIAVAEDIARQYPAVSAAEWKAQSRDWLERFAARRLCQAASVLAAAVIAAGAFAVLFPVTPLRNRPRWRRSHHVKSHGISGKVLNSYNFGGVLIFHGIKTFIDGRSRTALPRRLHNRCDEDGGAGRRCCSGNSSNYQSIGRFSSPAIRGSQCSTRCRRGGAILRTNSPSFMANPGP